MGLGKYFKRKSKEDIFTDIYKNHKWQGGKPETLSGIGSTLSHTENLRVELSALLKDLNIKTMLDIPCGDFNWMNATDLSMLDRYIGADIVKSLIENNKSQYQEKFIEFEKIDITNEILPQVDLILCRDLMIHLSIQDIHKALRNIYKSNSKYLLMNNFPSLTENKDIETGGHRHVNFLIDPFGFPKPKLTLEEVSFAENIPKELVLWNIESLKEKFIK